uniref:Uncharacterized protein n=1 Tax=Trichobilharzia regenti TaxID=157069 RepID=A0AA85J7R1_TRIRE|nr:unnamed protein product [Trichobilharzia regenti]
MHSLFAMVCYIIQLNSIVVPYSYYSVSFTHTSVYYLSFDGSLSTLLSCLVYCMEGEIGNWKWCTSVKSFMLKVEEHRASAARLHYVRFSARVFTWLHVYPHAFISSSSHDLLQVTLTLTTSSPLPFRSGSPRAMACLVMSLDDLFSQSMADPSPFLPAYLFHNRFLVGSLSEITVADVFWSAI